MNQMRIVRITISISFHIIYNPIVSYEYIKGRNRPIKLFSELNMEKFSKVNFEKLKMEQKLNRNSDIKMTWHCFDQSFETNK